MTSYTATNTYRRTTGDGDGDERGRDGGAGVELQQWQQLQHSADERAGERDEPMTLVLPTNVVAVQVVSQDLSQTNVYTVNVLLQPSQTVPHLTNSVSGNNLVLSWPADHLGYRLLMQTNNLNKGVSGNTNDWGTVAGSTSITATNIAIIKSGVTNEYYKLVYP